MPATATQKKPEADLEMKFSSTKLMDPVLRELMGIADYVSTIKSEIASLQVNAFSTDHLPSASGELNAVRKVTADAAHAIMTAGEEILDESGQSFEAYREKVEEKVLAIFEACSFQDLTGQRIAKVGESLAQLEKRLRRFAEAVGAEDDAGALDEEEQRSQERKKDLILNGPQENGVDQNIIDSLFD
jgi:chemotaxis protein CheZ